LQFRELADHAGHESALASSAARFASLHRRAREARCSAAPRRITRCLRAVNRAAELAKADLVTGMVGEFPELQGVMGRYYALHDHEDRYVADAIRDHYAPRDQRSGAHRAGLDRRGAGGQAGPARLLLRDRRAARPAPAILRTTAGGSGVIRIIRENALAAETVALAGHRRRRRA